MLFFRSEALIRNWCEKRGVEPRPLVTMDQLWQLAEMGASFEAIGLGGDFRDSSADTFH